MESIKNIKHLSGEKLQEIADITLIFNDQENRNLWETQIKNTDCTYYIIDEEIPDEIYNADIYFVYTQGLDRFFSEVYPNIKNQFKLVSHNSDRGIDSKYEEYLNGDKLVKWYCQNKHYIHPKLEAIPIGLANSQWPHGDFSSMVQYRESEKNNLVYKNFDKNTNAGERNICDYMTEKNGIFMHPNRPLEDYWKRLSESFFTISPPGNGIDCHRIWEALYLKTIPIVKRHVAFSDFEHLPILFIDNWKSVTIPFLRDNIKKFQNIDWNLDELNIEYWKDRIRK